MSQIDTLTTAFVAVIPAAVAFFWAYGRYDGSFRDNVVFLYFIGGLVMGGFLGFLAILSFSVISPLLAVLLLSLIFPIAVTVGINRRKWQGERHAIFNGGAFGLGVAVMLGFAFFAYLFKDHTWRTGGQSLAVAVGFVGIFFGLGLLAGNSVRLRKPLRFAFLGTAIVLPPVVFMEEFLREQVWLFPLLLAGYGIVFGLLAERKLLLEGVSEEARKERRRLRRKKAG